MATSSRLGTLGKLPLELRLAIYEKSMPWNHDREDRSRKHDPLAILRSCKTVYEETPELLYHDWTPTFVIDHRAISTRQSQTRNQYIDIEMRHPRYHTYNIVLSRATIERFQFVQYHKFKKMNILLKPTAPDDVGTLFDSFQAMKLLVECLSAKVQELPSIEVFARDCSGSSWHYQETESHYVVSNLRSQTHSEAADNPALPIKVGEVDKGLAGGLTDLHILLGPIGILKKTIAFHTTRKIASSHFVDPEAESVTIDDCEDEFVTFIGLEDVARKDETENTFYVSILGDQVQLIRTQALLESVLIHATQGNRREVLQKNLKSSQDRSREQQLILGSAAYRNKEVRRTMLRDLADRWYTEYPRTGIAHLVVSSKRIFEANPVPPHLKSISDPLQIQEFMDESKLEEQEEVILFTEWRMTTGSMRASQLSRAAGF